MPASKKGFLERLPKRVFELTGFHLKPLLRFCAVLLVAVVGIGLALLYTGAEPETQTYDLEGPVLKQLTDEEKFRDVSMMPGEFAKSLPVEQLGILNSKIETGEELVNSGGSYADQASEMLVFLYGTRCSLQELQRLDSKKSYQRLEELRQEAVEAGNEKRVASVDFICAIAATSRLKRRTEIADFRFASDAVLKLDSSQLVNLGEAQKLYVDAINLYNDSNQDNTAIYLSLLGDKLIGSPESEIADLGLNLKDYPRYFRFYEAIDKLPQSSPESKRKFYDELFAEVQKSPPVSSPTYRVIVQLLDRLVNKSDLQTASLLTSQLSDAAATTSPETKAKIEQSIENIKTRIAAIGKTIDLSGATFDGLPLKMNSSRRTTLLFWRPDVVESAAHLRLLAESEWFDPWETNVLVACPTPLTEKQLAFGGKNMPQFKVLDNATSHRLALDLGIDLVPYEVSVDKDGKVIRLGGATN